MKLNRNYFLNVFILLSIVLVFAGSSLAGNIEAQLADSNNSSSFQIKDAGDNVIMKVQSGGSVGIGTNNPVDTLEVEGALTVDGSGGLGAIRIRQNDVMTWTFLSAPWFGNDLHLRNEVAGYDIMTFDMDNFRIGIGTTDPQESLHTSGKVRTDGIAGIAGGLSVKLFQNTLYYQTSSASYKSHIHVLEDDFNKILLASPKAFIDRKSGCEEIGYIAEYFHQQGLHNLIIYKGKTPIAIKYDLISLYVLEVVKNQEKTIKMQEEEIKAQRNINKALEKRLGQLEARFGRMQ